jgi:hypothetical protein
MIRLVATTTRTDARRAALSRLIDHAALFPPASMSMDDALAEDRRVRSSAESWLVHRFVVPASRLADLPGAPPPLSVVLDQPLPGAVEGVEAVELRHPGELDGLSRLAPEVYVEIPAADPDELPALARLGLRAKVRCGGSTVPAVEALADFVRSSRGHGVVFKATAGLHHPVRRSGEHGFLNLLAAALFADDEEEALADEDATAFRLAADAFAWRHRSAGADEVALVRRELFVGFGSCSVAEPVADLRALGILAP